MTQPEDTATAYPDQRHRHIVLGLAVAAVQLVFVAWFIVRSRSGDWGCPSRYEISTFAGCSDDFPALVLVMMLAVWAATNGVLVIGYVVYRCGVDRYRIHKVDSSASRR